MTGAHKHSRTLICPEVDLEKPAQLLEDETGREAELIGPRNGWESLTIAFPGGSLRLTALREDRDKKQSQISLGLYNWCRMVGNAPTGESSSLANATLNAPLLIGVVADPWPAEDNTWFGLVHLLAAEMGALIFDARAIQESRGLILLDQQGESDGMLNDDELRRFGVLPT